MKSWHKVLGAFGVCIATQATAQTWVQTAAPITNWQGMACAADGSKLVAVVNVGGVYTSTNYGATWLSNAVPNLTWTTAASSADGSILAAGFSIPAGVTGGIFTSTNSGLTWTSNGLPKSPYSIACSGDGYLVGVAAFSSQVFFTTNQGFTWFTNTAPVTDVRSLAMSASGTKITGGNNVGWIVTKTNVTANWVTSTQLLGDITALTASADGQKVVALVGVNAGPVYASPNAGQSWSKQTNAPVLAWKATASSADGKNLIGVGSLNGTFVYTSTNSGANWTSNSLPISNWQAVTISADGTRCYAAAYNGGIWMLQQQTSAPQLSISLSNAVTRISWPIPATNFVIQQSSDLSNWADATNHPALNPTNLQYETSLPQGNGNGFLRLKSQ